MKSRIIQSELDVMDVLRAAPLVAYLAGADGLSQADIAELETLIANMK